MTDQQILETYEYETLLRAYQTEKGKIIASGQMASKSKVEDILMLQYPGMTKGLAHDIANDVERLNLYPIAPEGYTPQSYGMRWANR